MSVAKRVLSLLLAVILVWSISGANVVFAKEVAPTFEIGNHEGVCGDTVQVPVLVKGNPGIAAVKLKVTYDDNRLELTTVTYGSWGGSFQQPQRKTSPVSLTWYNGAENYTEVDSTFATLSFRILDEAKSGDSEISMTYEADNVYNIEETNIDFEVVNGKITVKGDQECEHSSTDTTYEDNGNETHTVTDVCSSCGETVSASVEDCSDTDQDDQCDWCGAELEPAVTVVPTFAIGAHEAAAGDTVQVPVLVKNNPGIAAVKLKVAYDDTRLELTTVTYGSWGGSFQQPQKKTSPVSLTWYNGAENYTEADSTFATLTFKVLDNAQSGDAEISMTYEPDNVYNIEETNIEFGVVNGKIVVAASETCDHSDTDASYEDNGDETHTITVSCESCGETISTNVEDCADKDQDGQCDKCDAELKPVIMPSFEIGEFEANCGDPVQVPILVKNNPGIAAIKLKVEYDDARLELTTITYGDWSGSFQQPQKKDSPVSLTWYNGAENYTVADSTFATLSFKVLDNAQAGDAEIKMTYEADNVYNIEETNIDFEVVNGKIVVSVPVHTHTPGTAVRENEVDATCKAAGSYDEVIYCSGCDEELSRVEKTIPKLNTHTPGTAVRENVVAASCKEAGSYDEVKYCSVCGIETSRVEKTIPKLTTHTPGTAVRENEVAATCKAAGSYDEVVYCSVCDAEISRVEKTIPKLTTHTPGTAVRENEVAATCKAAGSYDSVTYCSVCKIELNRVKKTIPKLTTHTPGTAVRENEVAATCKVAGSYDEVVYCKVCGTEISRVKKTIPQLATHTPGTAVRENEVAATCKAAGSYDAVTYCSVCGTEISRVKKTIPQLTTHTPGTAVRENEVAATCKAAGSYDSVTYCSVCGTEISRVKKTIPQLATHTSGTAVRENVVAATCKEAGSYDEVKYCSVCGIETSRVEKTIPQLTTHTPGTAVRENEVAATCKAAGSYDEVTYCTVCDAEISRVEKTIPKLNTHTPGTAVRENVVDATCKAAGSYDEVTYCTVCKVEISRVKKTIPQLTTHTPGTAVRENEVAATCKATGSYDEVTYCSVCKVEISRVKKTIPQLTTHTPGTSVRENEVAATCKAAGSYDEVVYCSVCDVEISRTKRVIPQLTTHTPDTAVRENEVAATCKTAGSYDEVVYCSVCDTEISRVEKTIPKLTTHTPDTAVRENEVAATCKEAGSYDEVVYCSVCDAEISRTEKTIDKLTTHIPSDWIIDEEPTRFEDGLKHKECEICGEILEEGIIPSENYWPHYPRPVFPFIPNNYEDEDLPFYDVSERDYYYDAVAWAYRNDITGGVSNNRFAPDQSCSRAQAVTFLWRAAGSPRAYDRTMNFVDVPYSSYYYDAVLWAVEQGIVTGVSATQFAPDAVCTRAQIVTMLWRLNGERTGDDVSFVDVKNGAYYAEAVKWAVSYGITQGTGNNTFAPDAVCTRAQIVTFLWRNGE